MLLQFWHPLYASECFYVYFCDETNYMFFLFFPLIFFSCKNLLKINRCCWHFGILVYIMYAFMHPFVGHC